MPKLDPFTTRRLTRFVDEHRRSSGQLPTLQDFERQGISRQTVDQAVKEEILEQLYINLTQGQMVKGYKIKVRDIV